MLSSAALREDNPSGTASHLEQGEKNGKDGETPGFTTRTYSRIAPAPSVRSDSDSDRVDIGRQMELEADAAIKYRTCSWQKVCFPSRHLVRVWCTNLATIGFAKSKKTLTRF